MAGRAKADPPPITASDVEPWNTFSPASYAEISANPLSLEFACNELGRLLVSRKDCARFFSRRLFIDFCCAVHEAYLIGTEPKESVAENYADPIAVRDKLRGVASSAADLLNLLGGLSSYDSALIQSNFGHGAQRHRNWRDDLPALQALLRLLAKDASNGAAAADAFVKTGPPAAPLTQLIHHIAIALQRTGVAPDATQRGALYTLCRVALELPTYKAVFGEPKSLRDSIRKVLSQERCDQSIPQLASLFRT